MTASLRLRDIGVEFPIYTGGSRSLKKVLFNRSTQGNLARDAHDPAAAEQAALLEALLDAMN